MLSSPSLLMVLIAGFFMALTVGILGRLRVKTRYLATLVALSVFVIVLSAFYMNDHSIYITSIIFALIASLFCGILAYFALKLGVRTMKK